MAEPFRWYVYTEDHRLYQVDSIMDCGTHVRVKAETGHEAVVPSEQIRFISLIPASHVKLKEVNNDELIFDTGGRGL